MEKSVTVADILKWMDEQAPFSQAEEWDNVGLLVGCSDTRISRVTVALDVSRSVIEQAVQSGAGLIISHHPVIFNPIKKLEPDSIPYLLARHEIASIAAHTNLDKAAGGVGDTLAARIGLKNITVAEDGLCRIGTLETEMPPDVFYRYVVSKLDIPDGGAVWSEGRIPVRTVAVCGGAGGDRINDILPIVDAFVTGEIHYHEWPLSACKTIIAAGHYHTEILAMCALKDKLKAAFGWLTVDMARTGCPYKP